MEKLSGHVSNSARHHNRSRLTAYCLGAASLFLLWQAFYLPWLEPSRDTLLDQQSLDILEEGLLKCAQDKYILERSSSYLGRKNRRHNNKTGQKNAVWIRNATVFDGEKFLEGAQDIYFVDGVVTITIATAANTQADLFPDGLTEVDAQGKWVTPGIVDMHSHHLIDLPGNSEMTGDGNEVNPDFGPLTPFVRSLDGMKAYDKTATYIAAGGVTSSLILPGSANIMGGEAFPVKNLLRAGPDGEEVVEELLLEYGIPTAHRQRYMKMACGENPKRVYDHTRMGNAFKFREQMAKGKELMSKQDRWCLSAAAAREAGDFKAIRELLKPPPHGKPGYPETLKLDSTVAMLRGKVNVNIHCYEPEDLEDMIRHSAEFGFPIHAFHHAIEAWRVPEMINNAGHNITIATFQDSAFYKFEAYLASLHAGKILTDHGVAVAYKSDHTGEGLNARYLLSQAAGAHSFGLSAELALQAVTSVPARSMNQAHRIGYLRPSYDADLVIWDSHPLSIGATPVEVYIDGRATINNAFYLADSQHFTAASIAPQMKKELLPEEKQKICNPAMNMKRLVLTGISKSFANTIGIKNVADNDSRMTLILESGKVACFGTSEECIHNTATDTVIALEDGHVLPGLTAVTGEMGLLEIPSEESLMDGIIEENENIFDPANLVYAKYGIHLEGKAFDRARIGGVTRVITPPLSSQTFIKGVSTAFRTTSNSSILNGGIIVDDLALHIVLGLSARSDTTPTTSDQISKLHKLIKDNKSKDSIYGQAATGKLPLIVHATNKYDIQQLIKLKRTHKAINLIILGGHGAPAVAQELADADIPIIFTAHRGEEDLWEKQGALPGPPLSKSPTRLLVEAGVKFTIAQVSDCKFFRSLVKRIIFNGDRVLWYTQSLAGCIVGC